MTGQVRKSVSFDNKTTFYSECRKAAETVETEETEAFFTDHKEANTKCLVGEAMKE